MPHYTAYVLWQRGDQDFLDNRYSRRHLVRFDGGVEFAGSSSPHSVTADVRCLPVYPAA